MGGGFSNPFNMNIKINLNRKVRTIQEVVDFYLSNVPGKEKLFHETMNPERMAMIFSKAAHSKGVSEEAKEKIIQLLPKP